jgi:prepilin-type N-terminal cleavage/methylation domain-containing protein
MSSVGKTSSLRYRAGVTLIEMLVVVAIIGIIASITAPSVAAGLDAVRMASATESVAAFLNAAVNRAERRQQAIELVISRKENKLTMYSNDPKFTRELDLPDGISIDAVLPDDAGPDALSRLILMPGASVPGISIRLANRRGGKRLVHLDPMTGFPHTEIVTSE